MGSEDGPGVVRSIAVSAEDVVAAFEYNRRNPGRAVLRITPPFHGRMRARLHVDRGEGYDSSPAPVHVPPERLIDAERAPRLPGADDTRPDEGDYSVEEHYERHVEEVEEWREAVRSAIVERVEFESPAGRVRADVTTLG